MTEKLHQRRPSIINTEEKLLLSKGWHKHPIQVKNREGAPCLQFMRGAQSYRLALQSKNKYFVDKFLLLEEDFKPDGSYRVVAVEEFKPLSF